MEQNIAYSIITPVYNREDCIMRCMESVTCAIQNLAGGGINVEHIIVDDGSHDQTCTLIEDYAAQHPHVVFVKFSQNRGTNAARNEAIRKARSPWCILLDSDDYFVDDAISIIRKTMDENPDYKHYMFAPDDMQAYYKENPILRGAEQKVLLYPDFLNGYIGGDFIHVCNTEILRRHPFDERLRIYEGTFFLMFFREAQQMLFTNHVVTIRERSRGDSVTRDVIRTNAASIWRNCLSLETQLQYFAEDLRQLGMTRRLHAIQMDLYDNYLLLGRYRESKALGVDWFATRREKLLHCICVLRLGWSYRLALQSYLWLKYSLFKTKLKC